MISRIAGRGGSRARLLILIVLVAAGCGDDEAPPPSKPGGGPGGGGGAGGGKPDDKKNKLQPRVHVEERAVCPAPDKPSGPACKPEAPTCEATKYCLQVAGGWNCEPCAERDSIRHEFKDRDFVPDQVRDPFQSFIILQKGLEPSASKRPEAGPCNRPDQFVATNYSYLDLKLVGIVAQGTQRKVLMMDRGNVGHIIRRGDCVGKEKALVKDVGAGYVTFVIQPDSDDKAPRGAPEERSMQLHPKGLQVAPPPQLDTTNAPTAPIVAPGSAPPVAPGSATAPRPAPPPAP